MKFKLPLTFTEKVLINPNLNRKYKMDFFYLLSSFQYIQNMY